MSEARVPGSGAVLAAAVGIGMVAAARTFLMPALLSRSLRTERGASSEKGPARLLASPAAGTALWLVAAGELVGDKLPITPDRTRAASLAARAFSGAFSAAAYASSRREPMAPAALVGAIGAIGGAYLLLHARRAAGRRLDVPDPFVAVAEDVAATAVGYTIARR
ncbi:MAG TPA: hypothetical protein VK929_12765 [Longimicrobiales bacterium]|nr:hypothetical protein [Longimicrobiales bacterium]